MIRTTQLLPEKKGLSFVDPDTLLKACVRGTEIHDFMYCLSTNKDIEQFKKYDYCQETLEKLDKQLNDMFGEPLFFEKRLYSETYQYTGQIDRAHKNAVIDYKTRKTDIKYDALQLAGYANLVKENYGYDIKNWYIAEIILDQDTEQVKTRLHKVYNHRATPLFLSLANQNLLMNKLEKKIKDYLEN